MAKSRRRSCVVVAVGVSGGFEVIDKVGQGWRPALPKTIEEDWPLLARLVEACWDQEPADRPEFSEIVERLSAVEREGMGAKRVESLTNTSLARIGPPRKKTTSTTSPRKKSHHQGLGSVLLLQENHHAAS